MKFIDLLKNVAEKEQKKANDEYARRQELMRKGKEERDKFFGKTGNKPIETETPIDTKVINSVLEYINNKKEFLEILQEYGRRCNRIVYSKSGSSRDILDSKLGGNPYCEDPNSFEGYNSDSWLFISQINLKDLPVNLYLPRKGILQFWVKEDRRSDISKVIFYKDPDKKKHVESKYNTEYDHVDYIDINTGKSGIKLEFEIDWSIDNTNVKYFDKLCEEDAFSVLFEEIADKYNISTEEVYGIVNNARNDVRFSTNLYRSIYKYMIDDSVFGYTRSIQIDTEPEVDSDHPTHCVLFQISDDEGETIKIGDGGVLRFINSIADCKKGKFDRADYYSDCY